MSVCLNAVPPWPPWSSKGSPECVNCGRPIRETGGGSALRRYVHVPQAELDEAARWQAEIRAAVDGSPGDLYDPPPIPVLRLPCGSLRSHGPHDWVGQTTGDTYRCAGGQLRSPRHQTTS